MKIIDNKKDYYDYLCGIYGIDEKIVFDRRGSIKLTQTSLFSTQKTFTDKKRKPTHCWVLNDKGEEVWKKVPQGTMDYFCLEVGNTHYIFSIERYLDDNDELVLQPTLMKKTENCKKRTKAYISIISCHIYRPYATRDIQVTYDSRFIIENPILSGTFIPKFITPDEIYDTIYNYISANIEPEIIDNRTDIEKLESKGMDRYTSFRNIK